MFVKNVYQNASRVTFVNVTPWWGGGPYGRIKTLPDEVWYPSPETVVGKAKWFTRHLYYLCLNSSDVKFDHSVLEEKVKDLFGYSNGGSARSSLFRVLVDPETQPKDDTFVKKYYEENKLMRVSLGLMGRKYLENLDLPINGVNFSISIDVLATAFKGSVDVAKRLVAALMLTLAYAGIGRAANRGFGRFYPVKYSNEFRSLAKAINNGHPIDAFKTGLGMIFEKCQADPRSFLDEIDCLYRIYPLNALELIGNAFIAKKYGMKGRDFAVFGLPRGRIRASLGGKKEIKRMQSPVIAGPVIVSNYRGPNVKSILLIRLYYGHIKDVNVDGHVLSPEQLEDKNNTVYQSVKRRLSSCR